MISFYGEAALGMDPKEFITFYKHLIPGFEYEVYEEDARTITFRDGVGRMRRALKEGSVGGARMSMDTYLDFPVKTMSGVPFWRKRALSTLS